MPLGLIHENFNSLLNRSQYPQYRQSDYFKNIKFIPSLKLCATVIWGHKVRMTEATNSKIRIHGQGGHVCQEGIFDKSCDVLPQAPAMLFPEYNAVSLCFSNKLFTLYLMNSDVSFKTLLNPLPSLTLFQLCQGGST